MSLHVVVISVCINDTGGLVYINESTCCHDTGGHQCLHMLS